MKSCLLLLLLNGCILITDAQDTLKQDNRDSIEVKSKFWVKPVIGLAYAGATWMVYRHADASIQRFSQKHQGGAGDFIFHAASPLGLGKTQTIELVSGGVLSLVLRNQKLQKTVIIWAGSLLINSTLTYQLKITFQRHRPSSGDPYNVFDWRKGPNIHRSFPSGHTSNSFTTATVWATSYSNKKWVPYVAYGLSTLVGLSRIYDNAHWASDVMAGAAIGFLSTKTMNGIYKLASKKILFLPQAHGFSMVYSFEPKRHQGLKYQPISP